MVTLIVGVIWRHNHNQNKKLAKLSTNSSKKCRHFVSFVFRKFNNFLYVCVRKSSDFFDPRVKNGNVLVYEIIK
jgi:hypothetical protein